VRVCVCVCVCVLCVLCLYFILLPSGVINNNNNTSLPAEFSPN